RNAAGAARPRLPRGSHPEASVAALDLVLPCPRARGPAVGGRTDQRLGDDRGRPSAVGRLPGGAHLAGGHRRPRRPRRLRDARREAATGPRELSAVGTVSSMSSVLTPLALRTAVGGSASGWAPVGNAAGGQFRSWLNATSLLVGALAVTTGAYLAAAFPSAD